MHLLLQEENLPILHKLLYKLPSHHLPESVVLDASVSCGCTVLQ